MAVTSWFHYHHEWHNSLLRFFSLSDDKQTCTRFHCSRPPRLRSYPGCTLSSVVFYLTDKETWDGMRRKSRILCWACYCRINTFVVPFINRSSRHGGRGYVVLNKEYNASDIKYSEDTTPNCSYHSSSLYFRIEIHHR